MTIVEKHTILHKQTVREALIRLDNLASDAILFLVDESGKLLGSLTDGDIRRGLIRGLDLDCALIEFVQPNPKFIYYGEDSRGELEEYRVGNLKIIPIVDREMVVIDILNFRTKSTIILADAVLMAGGRGKRLHPLTETTPKPLLRVGDKPIIEYNIDRLIGVGVNKINISINYLGEQIVEHFGNGESKGVSIDYLREEKPLGTIGSILLADKFEYDDIIVMNSDLLTNIDFADFFNTYLESGAEMAIATTSYNVDVPYAVLDVNDKNAVVSLKEKPRYTYYSNAGVYILKKELLNMIPPGKVFDITDLIEKVLQMSYRIITYPINGYWLDIGKPDDFKKAQEDIKHIKLV